VAFIWDAKKGVAKYDLESFLRFGLALGIYMALKVCDMASKELLHITRESSLEIHNSKKKRRQTPRCRSAAYLHPSRVKPASISEMVRVMTESWHVKVRLEGRLGDSLDLDTWQESTVREFIQLPWKKYNILHETQYVDLKSSNATQKIRQNRTYQPGLWLAINKVARTATTDEAQAICKESYDACSFSDGKCT
jgi:hypothetical protein